MTHSTELFFMIPSAVGAGCLYAQIIWTLWKGRQNDRKTTLARAFFFLWFFWIMFAFPYEVLDVYFMANDRAGTDATRPEEILARIIKRSLSRNSWLKTLAVVESCLRTLRNSYSFVNTILLLILVRPFSEPLAALYGKLRRLCCPAN